MFATVNELQELLVAHVTEGTTAKLTYCKDGERLGLVRYRTKNDCLASLKGRSGQFQLAEYYLYAPSACPRKIARGIAERFFEYQENGW